MKDRDGVMFTVIASVNGEQIGGRFNFFADDIEDFTQASEIDLFDYAEQIFDEVETHDCD